MKVIVALVTTFGGLGLLAVGIGGALGAYETPSGAFIVGGAVSLLVGISRVRALSGDPEESSHIPQVADPEDMPYVIGVLDQGEESEPHSDEAPHEYVAVPTPIEDRPTRPQLLQVGKVRRILVFAAIAAVLFGGAGRELIESLVDGLSGNDTPNIPVHILEACNEAFADQEGPAASFGQAYQYEQRADGTEDVLFRTAQGSEWDCRWDPTAFTAEITATRQAG